MIRKIFEAAAFMALLAVAFLYVMMLLAPEAFAQVGLVPQSNTSFQVEETATGAGTTAATTATLPALPGRMTYICGFSITSTATTGLASTATVATVISGSTLTFGQAVGTSPAVASTLITFSPCLSANAINTAITVTSAAAGTAGVTNVSAWGFTNPSP